MKFKFLTFLSAFFIFANPALADETGWVKTDQSEVRLVAGGFSEDGKTLHTGVHFKINDGWKIYWKAPGDVGLPITYNWKGSTNFEKAKEYWPAPIRHVDFGSIENIVYEKEVVIPVDVEVNKPSAETGLKVHVNFAICKEICLISDAKLELAVPENHSDSDALDLINNFKSLTPKANGEHQITINDMKINLDAEGRQVMNVFASKADGFAAPEIFIVGPENFRFPVPKLKAITENNTKAEFEVAVESLIADKKFSGGSIEIVLKDGEKSVFNIFEVPSTGILKEFMGFDFQTEIGLMILFSILGGLILNVMPCVLPVLSIKLLGVAKHGGSTKKKIRASFLSTSAGIISSFILLAAIVISLKNIGMQVGWGFHFQEPIFIITMVVILAIFSANMWGLFEIRLPQKVSSLLGGVKINDNTKTGSFLEGALATTLATPCTAPFLGTAIGYAFSKGAFETLVIFFFLGVGLALPYIIIALFPKMVSGLPKPGGWMVKLKYFMGLLLFVTAVWLVASINQQLGYISAIILFSILVLIIFAFYINRFSKFLSSIVIVLFIGLAFFLPHFFSEKTKEIAPVPVETGKWVKFVQADIKKHVDSGKVVFVDITADWCLTCKANEILVLSKNDVKEKIFTENVIAMRGDWTRQDKAIGDYLKMHNRYGIPFNAVYGPNAPEGIILPELLNKQAVLEALEKAGKK